MTGVLRVAAALVAAALLSACGEQPQELGAAVKGSAPAWEGTGNPYVAEGWKPGDQASWDEQMRRRARAQNEYVRIGGAS